MIRQVDTDPWVVDKITLVAKFFGVTEGAVRKWINKGMPREHGERARHYRYDLSVIYVWRQQIEEDARDASAPGQDDQESAELEREKERIDVAHRRLKYLNEAGKLILRDVAIGEIQNMLNRIRSRLEALPEELGSSMPPDVRADYIQDAKHKVRLVLTEIAGWATEV